MKKNKFIIISFLIVIFGVFLLIPTKFLLVKLSVLDINYDNSKVIGNRSYGKTKEEVIRNAIQALKILKAEE